MGVRKDDIRDSRSVSDCLDLVDIWIAKVYFNRTSTTIFIQTPNHFQLKKHMQNSDNVQKWYDMHKLIYTMMYICSLCNNLKVNGWVFVSVNSTEWLWISYEAWIVLNLKVRKGLRLILLSDTYTFVFDLEFWIVWSDLIESASRWRSKELHSAQDFR